MAHKHLKNSGIAAIVLGCALGVAQAAGTTSPPIDPSQLRTLLKLKPGDPIPQRGGGRVTPGPSTVVGWNFKVCIQSYLARNTTNGFLLFAENSDGSFFHESSTNQFLSFFQNQLLAACQHAGGGYFVHIIDPSTNAFDDLDIFYP